MSGTRYPCSTVVEMAAIPVEARERFLAEMPAMLRTIDELREAAPALAAEVRAKAPRPWCWLPVSFHLAAIRVSLGKRMIWIDDDKGLATVSVRMSENSAPFYSRTEKHTGESA
jgi:hypothetical protein